MLQIGSVLGDYRVLRHLGAGGMGDVYLVENIHIGTRYALKTIKTGAAITDAVTAQFRLEARVMATLEHPNIVKVHHAGGDAMLGLYYLVMDYIDGVDGCVSLEDQLAHGERFPQERVLAIARQLASALNYAHGHPSGAIIHRDLKPSNILLGRDGKVLVSDFGLATVLRDATGGVDGTAERTGNIVGTFDYMSPEQQEGKPASPQSDIYSLGLILYRLLTGIQAKGRWPLPSECGASREWDAIIETALSPEPTERYGSLSELGAALDALEQKDVQRQYAYGARSYIAGEGKRIGSILATERKRSRRVRWVLLILLVAACGVVTAVLLSPQYKAYRIYGGVQAALDRNAWEEADGLLMRMRQYDQNSDRYMKAGDIFFDHRQFGYAYKCYQLHKPADYRFVLAAFFADDVDRAAKEAELVLRRDESARSRIGYTAFLSNNDVGILKWIIGTKLQRVDGDIPMAYDSFKDALSRLDEGEVKNSVSLTVQSIQDTSKKMEGLYKAAWDSFNCKQFAAAYDSFKAVYRGTIDSTLRGRARLAMGQCAYWRGDAVDAKNILLDVHSRINWSQADANMYRMVYVPIAKGLWEEGNGREALQYVRTANEKIPDDCGISNTLAWYLVAAKDRSLRRPHEALEIALETVRRAKTASAAYYDTLAACYASVNDFQNAVKVQQQAVRLTGEGDGARKYQESLNSYLKEQIPWDEDSGTVEYARKSWELCLERHRGDLPKLREFAAAQWKATMAEVATAEKAPSREEQIACYRKATRLLAEATSEIRKPSLIRFEIGSASGTVYRRDDKQCFCLGKTGAVLELTPFEEYTLEIREPGKIWRREVINVDRPNHDYGTRVVELDGRPDGGDEQATSWRVLGDRLVLNIYTNGDETIVDKETSLMWVYDPTAWGIKTWDDANEWCRTSRYAGYSNWTLPGQKDLLNLVHQKDKLPIYNYKDSMDPSKIKCYWTTDMPMLKSHAFVITASLTNSYSYSKSDRYGVWPMRRNDGSRSVITSKEEQR